MKEKDLIETLVEQISQMLDLIRQNDGFAEKELSPGIMEQLAQLEKDVELLQTINENVAASSQIDTSTSNLNPREKHLLDTIKKMKKDALALQTRYEFVSAPEKKTSKSTDMKKKLKPIGSRKNWNRL